MTDSRQQKDDNRNQDSISLHRRGLLKNGLALTSEPLAAGIINGAQTIDGPASLSREQKKHLTHFQPWRSHHIGPYILD